MGLGRGLCRSRRRRLPRFAAHRRTLEPPAPARGPALGADLPRRRAPSGGGRLHPSRAAHGQSPAPRADRRMPHRAQVRLCRPRRGALFGKADRGRQDDRAVYRADAARGAFRAAERHARPSRPEGAAQRRLEPARLDGLRQRGLRLHRADREPAGGGTVLQRAQRGVVPPQPSAHQRRSAEPLPARRGRRRFPATASAPRSTSANICSSTAT